MLTSSKLLCSYLLYIAACQICATQSHEHGKHSTHGLHDDNVVHNREFLSEHYKDLASLNMTAMSNLELEFYYFRLHDHNKDSRLDGLELYNGMLQLMGDHSEGGTGKSNRGADDNERSKMTAEIIDKRNEAIVVAVDNILEEDDTDGDGYLSWQEFWIARKREASHDHNHHDQTKH